jgi:NAD(P)-dependent dehydrogenase (short-subunit alcohol dehydrogenase family)
MNEETNIMTDQKVAIVTGGARGIGRAIAVELARAGYYLVINYKANDQAAQETLAMIREAGSAQVRRPGGSRCRRRPAGTFAPFQDDRRPGE